MTNETGNDRPAATDELSDEALAKIAFHVPSDPDGRGVFGWDLLSDAGRDYYTRVARAVRAALTEGVAPLGPGETVTIRDAADALYGLRLYADDRRGRLSLVLTQGGYTGEDRHLDAAGVAALAAACRRWLAAQNGGK